ncbi:GNAT family N-acetyltransferase [Nocardia sp. NPDC050717]|uniref:GNAT family N-acetyltransferase n=1 Tax=Nocardia sp. NPDC050717 TaxID=3157221 RepID=UPI00340173E4
MPTSIRPLTTADLDRAAQILGAAFADYPWTTWCVARDDHLRRVTALQRLYLEHLALPHGRAYIDDTGNGVLALIPSDAPAPSEEVSARIAELHGDRLDRLMAAEERMSTLPVPDGAWLLATIGTTPDSRGTGLGTALMAHGLAELDLAGHPCWLDTSTERNLRLYERFGFAVVGHLTHDGVPVWRMHRHAA